MCVFESFRMPRERFESMESLLKAEGVSSLGSDATLTEVAHFLGKPETDATLKLIYAELTASVAADERPWHAFVARLDDECFSLGFLFAGTEEEIVQFRTAPSSEPSEWFVLLWQFERPSVSFWKSAIAVFLRRDRRTTEMRERDEKLRRILHRIAANGS